MSYWDSDRPGVRESLQARHEDRMSLNDPELEIQHNRISVRYCSNPNGHAPKDCPDLPQNHTFRGANAWGSCDICGHLLKGHGMDEFAGGGPKRDPFYPEGENW